MKTQDAGTVKTDDAGPAPDRSDTAPPWIGKTVRSGIWTLIGAILITLALLWFANQARNLIRILIVSQLLAYALEPGVMWLHEHRGWRRGSATAAILGGTFVAFLVLILAMIPPLANGVNGIVRSVPHWIDQLNGFTREHFHATVVSTSGKSGSSTAATNVSAYLKQHTGDLVGAAAGVLGAVFNIFTIGMFTFYLTADGPKVRRALFSRMPKARQERATFAANQAIRKMGGYLYSKGLLALINAALLFIVLLIVGCPFALPIALFAGIVAEFIPIVGTYIAGVVPVVVTLAAVGLGGAVAVVAEILLYQGLENYYLSPRISQRTMELNAGIAFGAAMAGGAVGGFVGAFFALPIAAVIQSFLSAYTKTYDVEESSLTELQAPKPAKPPRKRRRRRRSPAASQEGPSPEAAANPATQDAGP
jgi:predicted PurR-regulated permease PerM